MTDKPQDAIVTTQGSQIQYVGERNIVKELSQRIRLLVVGGKHLTDDEALALAQYSVANDLNPMIGECYFLPNIGPGPGIAGWRKKAELQLRDEARRANEPRARYWCDYSEPDPKEIKINPGDIAVKATIHDDLTKTAWEKRRLSYYIDMKKAGANGEAWGLAKELAGDEPTWSAVAIVRSSENFGAQEKMDRYERACKRAEKAAIRKRFPLVNLVEPEGFDDTAAPQVVSFGIIDSDPEPEKLPRSEAQIMSELGY